jgi:hypothetical protein
VIKSSRRPTKRSGPAATSYQETGVMGCRKSESREGKLARRERSELQRYDSGSGEVPSQRRSDSRVKSGHPCPRGILRCLRNSAQNPLKNLAWVANLATIRVSWSASAVTGSAFLRRYDIHTDTARWQIGGVGREGARVDKRTGGCQKGLIDVLQCNTDVTQLLNQRVDKPTIAPSDSSVVINRIEAAEDSPDSSFQNRITIRMEARSLSCWTGWGHEPVSPTGPKPQVLRRGPLQQASPACQVSRKR